MDYYTCAAVVYTTYVMFMCKHRKQHFNYVMCCVTMELAYTCFFGNKRALPITAVCFMNDMWYQLFQL